MSTPLPTIKLDGFEGPFDLLLELAHQRRIDVRTLSLSNITDQFLLYLKLHPVSATVQADFLIVAATLLLIKLRQLVPSLTAEEETELTELSDRVRRYNVYREEALRLRSQWTSRRLVMGPVRAQGTPFNVPINTQGLVAALERVNSRIRLPLRPIRHLHEQKQTLQRCLELVQDRLRRLKMRTFSEIVQQSDRSTVALSFLALLELVRRREIRAQQMDTFATITLEPL